VTIDQTWRLMATATVNLDMDFDEQRVHDKASRRTEIP
jgi:hypothetical protein